MAIYEFQISRVSRGGADVGRSVVASAAYRSGEEITDETKGKTFNYSNRHSVDLTQIELPTGSEIPAWATDRAQLWNKVESFEKRPDATLAQEIRVALPREFNEEQNVKLISDYIKTYVTSKGRIADVCIHGLKENHNPHVHVLTTTRALDGDDFAKTKDRSWDGQAYVKAMRKAWEATLNNHLNDNGFDLEVSCLPKAKQEKYLGMHGKHLTREAYGMEMRGKPSAEAEILANKEDKIQDAKAQGDIARQQENFVEQRENAGFTKASYLEQLGSWWQSASKRLTDEYSDFRDKIRNEARDIANKVSSWYKDLAESYKPDEQSHSHGKSDGDGE